MSVKEAQSKIDSAEFTEWVAYHNLKPFTFDSVENILSIIAAMIANSVSKKGAKQFKPQDFVPKLKRIRKEDPEAMQIKLKSMFGFK